MPVKFLQMIVRFWFFLSYLITTVPNFVRLSNKEQCKTAIVIRLEIQFAIQHILIALDKEITSIRLQVRKPKHFELN